jgi:hypothetical protein
MSDYDSPWKEALDEFFEAFLKLFFSLAHVDIDWTRPCEPLDKELQQIAPDAEVGRRYVDKLVKVWLKSGDEQWVLIHVEVQTSADPKFGWRMYIYNARLYDKYNREVASFAVLADDNPNWRPDRFGYERWGVKAEVQFPIVKLLDFAERRPELEQSENPFATVVLAHLDTMETRRDQTERKDRKFRLTRRLLKSGLNENRVRQLYRLIDWMMDLPKELAIEYRNEITKLEEASHMPFVTTVERLAREEGIEEGVSRGTLRGIEVALNLKFGASGLSLLPEIRAIDDNARLETILDSIESAASPDELRRIWTG